MVDTDRQFQDLKKEVVETRNLVIKNDNLLKSLLGDVKRVLEKQETSEKRAWRTGVTAYIAFATLAALGAFMFASVKVSATVQELAGARAAREKADASAAQIKASMDATATASKKALEVFEKLAGDEESERNHALSELSRMDMKKLSPMEQRALEDKSHTLRLQAAQAAFDSGRQAMNRREWKLADEELTRYLSLADKPEDQAYLLLGNARHALRDYKDAVEPLQTFLKNLPNSKQGDYATVLLGEAMQESGDLKGAEEVYRNGGNKYLASQFNTVMRARARRLEHLVKDSDKTGNGQKPL